MLVLAAVLLRREARAGRLAVLALGLGTVATTDATTSPVGPARVVLPRG